MKIYTRGGDKGETGLAGGDRVRKSHPRVAAYGDVDELNCALGAARTKAAADPALSALDAALARVQAECFHAGSILATPPGRLARLKPPLGPDLPAPAAARLESEIDAWTAELPALDRFLLPGGGETGAALHLARAVCRRAERSVVELAAREPLPEGVIVYLNRLSDWLFTAARWANRAQGKAETAWPGARG